MPAKHAASWRGLLTLHRLNSACITWLCMGFTTSSDAMPRNGTSVAMAPALCSACSVPGSMLRCFSARWSFTSTLA